MPTTGEEMKAIRKYQAEDGSEFNSEADCIAYEALCAEIDEVMATLPPRPNDDGCGFSNGHGYLQHDRVQFIRARTALLHIANRLMPHKWFEQALADETIHASWAGRLISEMSRPLDRAWSRFMCIDDRLREWGQPYYAAHPEDAPELACLNP
jgi:hypothetical protein